MPASWQFILDGMEFHTDPSAQRAIYPRTAEARREFEMLRAVSPHAIRDLPAHCGLANDILGTMEPRLAAV